MSSAVLTADVKSLGLGTISGDGKVQKGKRVKKKKKEREKVHIDSFTHMIGTMKAI